MAENSEKRSDSLKILRERRGPVPEELRERVRRHREAKRAIRQALAEGPLTVPELAQRTGLPSHEVFWHIISMRKYGEVAEGEQEGDYFRYLLLEKGRK